MKKLKLGIIYKDGKLINHRSLLKVLFNPILRYFGYCIGTPFDIDKNKLNGYMKIFKCEKSSKIEYQKYDIENIIIVKKRMLI